MSFNVFNFIRFAEILQSQTEQNRPALWQAGRRRKVNTVSYQIDKDGVVRAFNEYVSGYNAADPKIRLKIDHTFHVASLCERIAVGIADPALAWLCGMLHDIGRFEQVRRYGTFVDSVSVDHAALGADLLFREGLLDRFAPHLPADRRRILETAIRHHSAYRLPEGLADAEVACCHILRDADKIDIFRANCETPLEDIYNVTTEALRASPVSEAVKDCFRNRTAVPRALKQTPADYVVALLCLSFELVYPISREIAREQGCIDRMLAFESDNEDTRNWFGYMKSTIGRGR